MHHMIMHHVSSTSCSMQPVRPHMPVARYPGRALHARCFSQPQHTSAASHTTSSHDLQPPASTSRRSVLHGTASALAAALLLRGQPALASERGLARYIRKKRLDPLDTYVPVVLVARDQLLQAGEIMISQPAPARELLRQGAFDGLRESVRALGSYAEQNNTGLQASALVNAFFRSLEDFDQILGIAVRESQPVAEDAAKEGLQETLKALDDLLDTVPQDILNKSRQVVEVTREKERAAAAALATDSSSQGAGADTPNAALVDSEREQLPDTDGTAVVVGPNEV